MSLAERVKELIQKKQVTPYEISVKTGISQSTLSRIINNSTSKPNIKNIEALANYFHVSRTWLLTGEGEMLKSDKPKIESNATFMSMNDYVEVEFADLRACAGRLGGGIVENLPDTHKRLIPRKLAGVGSLVIAVDGDSMNDGTERSLSDGDEVLVREIRFSVLDKLPIRKSLFIITSLEGNVLKQITEVNEEEQYIICHSFNPLFDDYKMKFENICQIFEVISIVYKPIRLS